MKAEFTLSGIVPSILSNTRQKYTTWKVMSQIVVVLENNNERLTRLSTEGLFVFDALLSP